MLYLYEEDCFISIELKKGKKALQWIALTIENNQLIDVKKANGV